MIILYKLMNDLLCPWVQRRKFSGPSVQQQCKDSEADGGGDQCSQSREAGGGRTSGDAERHHPWRAEILCGQVRGTSTRWQQRDVVLWSGYFPCDRHDVLFKDDWSCIIQTNYIIHFSCKMYMNPVFRAMMSNAGLMVQWYVTWEILSKGTKG